MTIKYFTDPVLLTDKNFINNYWCILLHFKDQNNNKLIYDFINKDLYYNDKLIISNILYKRKIFTDLLKGNSEIYFRLKKFKFEYIETEF